MPAEGPGRESLLLGQNEKSQGSLSPRPRSRVRKEFPGTGLGEVGGGIRADSLPVGCRNFRRPGICGWPLPYMH